MPYRTLLATAISSAALLCAASPGSIAAPQLPPSFQLAQAAPDSKNAPPAAVPDKAPPKVKRIQERTKDAAQKLQRPMPPSVAPDKKAGRANGPASATPPAKSATPTGAGGRNAAQNKQDPATAQKKQNNANKPASGTWNPDKSASGKNNDRNNAAANDNPARKPFSGAGRNGLPATAGSPAAPDSERNAASKDRRDRNGPRDAMRGRGDLDAMPRGRRDAVDLDSIRRQRREMTEDGGKTRIITEPGNRRIIRSGDRMFIQHSERDRLERFGKGRTNRRKDGTVRSVIERDNGVKIVSIYAQDGRLLERRRIGRGGREIVLIDNRHDRRGRRGGRLIAPLALGALSLSIPRSQYIVEYDDASPERIYETLSAPPVEKLDRAYTVDEIRQSRALRQRLRRVDLNAINFATGSWDVPASEKRQLERIASATKRLIDKNPREIFLIEGYTDAVGDAEDNLTLSDRRAESIAAILTQDYGVPPENLLVQGYGEQYLKVNTDGPSARNRRVAIRRVTPLLRTAGK